MGKCKPGKFSRLQVLLLVLASATSTLSAGGSPVFCPSCGAKLIIENHLLRCNNTLCDSGFERPLTPPSLKQVMSPHSFSDNDASDSGGALALQPEPQNNQDLEALFDEIMCEDSEQGSTTPLRHLSPLQSQVFQAPLSEASSESHSRQVSLDDNEAHLVTLLQAKLPSNHLESQSIQISPPAGLNQTLQCIQSTLNGLPPQQNQLSFVIEDTLAHNSFAQSSWSCLIQTLLSLSQNFHTFILIGGFSNVAYAIVFSGTQVMIIQPAGEGLTGLFFNLNNPEELSNLMVMIDTFLSINTGAIGVYQFRRSQY